MDLDELDDTLELLDELMELGELDEMLELLDDDGLEELLLELLDEEEEDDDDDDESEELLLELELLLPSQHRHPMVRYALVSSWKWQTIC